MELLCPWESASYFLYSSNIPTFFFYSHIPAIIVALLVGLLVFFKSGKSRTGVTLLIINIIFSLWCFFDLILWATNKPDTVMFFWSMQILLEPLIYLLCFYLLYAFIKDRSLDFKWMFAGILFYSPIVLLLASDYNIIGVEMSYCTALEGFIAQYYTYIVEAGLILSILFLTAYQYTKVAVKRKREIVIFSLGVILFLIAFSSGNIIGSFTENWTLAQAGLIGMPIFVGFIAYMIVKFHVFNIKLIATQVLIATIWLLIFGILFIRNIENVQIVTALTLILVTIAGDLLIKSVKREVLQKEELAKLNLDLKDLIKQRENLVHLVTHKVKGSFTRSKFIFAGILDGTFGEISPEIKKVAGQGLESDNMGIETVDLVLSVANMQKGIVKYDMKEMNLKDIVVKTIEEKRIAAENKGLQLKTNIQENNYKILGDVFWMKEVINNLIENSIKYTTQGEIVISLEKKDDKVVLMVKDTGIGISDEDKQNLFTEGGRGKDSVKVNVDSTGYGLYSVKLIVVEHKGRVFADSDGIGKGSTFTVELPLLK